MAKNPGKAPVKTAAAERKLQELIAALFDLQREVPFSCEVEPERAENAWAAYVSVTFSSTFPRSQ